MELSFYGAAKEVTGSCYHLQSDGIRFLIDCGMQQGKDKRDNDHLPFNPQEIDAVLVTHAHIDHSARLPLLVKLGFSGPIYATTATCNLLDIMLKDSAHIQKMDAEWENRKGKRAGKDLAEPMYTLEDVENTLKMLVPCNYNKKFKVKDDGHIEFMLTDAGHLLGSSSVHVWVHENGETRKLVFSGDIGNLDQPIIKDPQYIDKSDIVVMEGLYGDRDHEHKGDYLLDLAAIVDKTLGRGGNVVIPSFAVGRTQELLYFFREMKEQGLIKSKPDFKVFVDSPLAGAATRIYEGDLTEYADELTQRVLSKGGSATSFPGLTITESVDESKAINFDREPKVIISSSGMCEAGRIRHHLKHNLWCPQCTIIFVGFQANGTLGRIILEGAKKIKLFGEEIAVKSEIVNFRGLSAHADRSGLLKWIGSFDPKPGKVFIVHAEAQVAEKFSDDLNGMGFNTLAPNYMAKYNLLTGETIYEGEAPEEIREGRIELKKESDVYSVLVTAGEGLLDIIKRSGKKSDKDLRKFTEQVKSLIKRWK